MSERISVYSCAHVKVRSIHKCRQLVAMSQISVSVSGYFCDSCSTAGRHAEMKRQTRFHVVPAPVPLQICVHENAGYVFLWYLCFLLTSRRNKQSFINLSVSQFAVIDDLAGFIPRQTWKILEERHSPTRRQLLKTEKTLQLDASLISLLLYF